MAEQTDTNRLIELLISRQDHQQDQLDKLAATFERLEGSLSKTDETLIVFGKVQLQMIDRLDGIHTEQLQMNKRLGSVEQHLGSVEQRLDAVQAEQARQNQLFNRFVQAQLDFNNYQLDFNRRQEEFNKRQEEFNKRQDEFNIIFLDEIRALRREMNELTQAVAELKEALFVRIEERLRRLEDFMNGFKNAA